MVLRPNGYEPGSRPAERRAQYDLNRRLVDLLDSDGELQTAVTTLQTDLDAAEATITALQTQVDALPRGEIVRTSKTANETSTVNFFVSGLSIGATLIPGRKYKIIVHFGSLTFSAAPAVGGRWHFTARADSTAIGRVAELAATSTTSPILTVAGVAYFQLAGGITVPTSVAFSVLGTLAAGSVGVSVNATSTVPSTLSVEDIGPV